ncbi:glycoside hydrolase family 5 protein [Halomontanus rarus]|uniref:glycoside hydrolase family 5 protein n=1 Tax=Halomontanus rarus TaxID=3034020 RepID=UPI0023E86FDF|nr:cellulase family glycosylhydrolase [Halovivax sp. TS33]
MTEKSDQDRSMPDNDHDDDETPEYRRSIQRTTSRGAPGETTGDTTGYVPDAADRSRRAFLAAMGVGAGTLALGAGSVAADHDEIPRDSVELGDRGISTPWLYREGNELKDPDGNTVVLRGVNVTDPARAESLQWRSPLWQNIEHATDPDRGWYARIIRIPVQTGDVANVDPDDGSILGSPTDEVDPGEFTQAQLEAYVDEYLRPAVDFCREVGVYCIVDYHRHDDQSVEYTDPDLHEEVTMFWETVAPEFAEDSHVLYEVYNEPIGPYAGEGQNEEYDVFDPEGEETWLLWRETAQPWVDTIREHAADNVIIIGSPRWSQWTYWAPEHEFEGENLAYAAHVYTHENLWPLAEVFVEPSEQVPVFLSEFGWTTDFNADFLVGTPEEHGAGFKEFLQEYDSIHWQVWCFDPFWQPIMFDFDDSTHDWELLGGDYQGEFLRDYLAEKRDDDVPLASDGTESPPAPAELSVTRSSETTLELSWTAVDAASSYGIYVDGELEAETKGTEATVTVDSTGELEVGVTAIDEDGNESNPITRPVSDGDGPPTIDGSEPADTTGDGLYNDLTGSGETTTTDVTVFFEHVDEPAVAEYPQYYDFDGNGQVSVTDVVTLFDSL